MLEVEAAEADEEAVACCLGAIHISASLRFVNDL